LEEVDMVAKTATRKIDFNSYKGIEELGKRKQTLPEYQQVPKDERRAYYLAKQNECFKDPKDGGGIAFGSEAKARWLFERETNLRKRLNKFYVDVLTPGEEIDFGPMKTYEQYLAELLAEQHSPDIEDDKDDDE
jgi:O6-methylguanine-DNA--protein-cysteine methyltransferase